MQEDNPFWRTLKLLRTHGWTKNTWYNSRGQRCILGGLDLCLGAEHRWSDAEDILNSLASEMFPDRIAHGSIPINIIDMNNHDDTTFEDIEQILEKAAVKWEERI